MLHVSHAFARLVTPPTHFWRASAGIKSAIPLSYSFNCSNLSIDSFEIKWELNIVGEKKSKMWLKKSN